ncbi:MAG: mobile mystery protein B [Candidatus Marinimicrobia bacterium]|mgnify:FL=1|jgi:Fic-DOC domain mobile mystery protein B|nr:mobile mystery protein B [Candidatus Neomarinimicrobiota bacterium]MBT3500754.1 mobile mystery protein B [Candidatus Neomarinimicrobiota bacterium]MBT3838701.1 mobile mystery protein B [Candidatus Neomarinimicrobiota bacterium]MBT3998387.1 mobile mystery protein B [Candidatus Neomarinimicrobiota bacterium]MBT4283627.1 mobile mystery protein B [Candidatus Neomarinimicrobiota bacterium]
MGLEIDYIYGQTPITEEEKEGLMIQTISNRKELDEFEQLNIETAVEWSLKQKFTAERILTTKFILDVHKRMFNKTWKWAGKIRTSNKNLGIDKFQINQEMKVVCDDCKYWIENNTYSDEEIAIRFKHRIVSVHPFPNGNGRHSRLCADILISHVFNKDVFSWGRFNLVKPGDSRKKYLEAIYVADNGDIRSLLEFART